jgi:hypothetical protein
MVRKDIKEQIAIFVKRLKVLGRFTDTFYALENEGILTRKMCFYRENKNIQKALINVKDDEIKLFIKVATEKLSLRDAYNYLKDKGLLNYAISFYKDNCNIKVTELKKERKIQEYKLLRDHAIFNGISLLEAHKQLHKESKLTFSYLVLLDIEKEIEDKDVLSKREKTAVVERAKRIVKNYEETYFQGRIMTKEVSEAYKILEL